MSIFSKNTISNDFTKDINLEDYNFYTVKNLGENTFTATNYIVAPSKYEGYYVILLNETTKTALIGNSIVSEYILKLEKEYGAEKVHSELKSGITIQFKEVKSKQGRIYYKATFLE